MSMHNEEQVARLRADIEAESAAQPPSQTPEEMRESAAARHLLAQHGEVVQEPVVGQGRNMVVPISLGHISGKAAKIILEVSESGEPIFVLRAKDFFSIQVVAAYCRLLEEYGPEAHDMVIGAHEQLQIMKEWQRANINQVKYPD